ncbi:MAG: DUF4876 domain-containing protein [Pedobacter sp.]
MKKIAYLMLFTVAALFSCKKDKGISVHSVTVQLAYPSASAFNVAEGVIVKLTGKGTAFEATTNAEGKATLSVPTDIYEISASDVRSSAGTAFVYNGLKSNIAVVDGWNSNEVIKLELAEAKTSQLVIKEVFVGGTPKGDGTAFSYDGYIVIYNNSNYVANTNNLCIGAIGALNAHATNAFYVNDKLMYENEGWIPANSGFWYFQQNVTIKPGEQIVIALYNAVNNTITFPNSINFDNKDYYVTYDVAGQYRNVNYYVTPAASIPTSHYLKSVSYAAGNAWVPSFLTPGIFLFETKDTTPAAFGADVTNVVLSSNKKVPVSWVVDGIESFLLNNTNNRKRFLPSIDAGYVYHVNREGYSIYRNVDEAATKAIAGNEAKLKYGYALGTTAAGGTTDPSGIDAEASIKNGARIIYKDTNNSTNDTHLRSKASLRTN